METITINLEKVDSSAFEYPASTGRVPPYIKQVWVLCAAMATHFLVWNGGQLDGVTGGASGSWGFVSLFLFPLAILVGAYVTVGYNRHRKAIDAIDLMTSTVESIGLQISLLEEKGRRECHTLFVYVLRAVYASARGYDFVVKQTGQSEVANDHAPVLKEFARVLHKHGINGQLLSGNGALNRFLLARAQSKSVISVRLSVTLKVCCVVMLLITLATLSLYLQGSGFPVLMQSVIFGIFAYAVWLMIVVADDLGHPYGQGMSKVPLRERFASYERRLKMLSL